MFHNLALYSNTVRIMNGVVAGTSDQTSSALDMEDYDGVLILAAFGVVSANAVSVVKVQQSSDDAVADDYTDLTGTASTALTATTDNNKIVVIDIYRPQKRYLKVVFTRSTGNVVIDGIFAVRYHGKAQPAALHATVLSQEVFSYPAEGTA